MRTITLKRASFWVLAPLLAVGCAAGLGQRAVGAVYRSALVQIDRPEATRERYGAVVTIRPEPDNKYVYEDGLFSGVFFVTSSRINFTITNKTDHSIKIVWDEAAFIETDGTSNRVAHQGVKYADRNASQPATVVPRGTSITDFVLPTSRVYYREGYYGKYYSSPGGWRELDLVQPALCLVSPGDSTAVRGFRSQAEANIGKRFGLLLPLEIQGVVNEYTFWFQVQGASVVTQ